MSGDQLKAPKCKVCEHAHWMGEAHVFRDVDTSDHRRTARLVKVDKSGHTVTKSVHKANKVVNVDKSVNNLESVSISANVKLDEDMELCSRCNGVGFTKTRKAQKRDYMRKRRE